MAPNSEENPQIEFQSKRNWGMDSIEKEPLRPPVYNPEDYATSLKKWGRKTHTGMQLPLYLSQSTGSIEKISTEITQGKRQSSPSTKSSFSIKSGDEKQSKKERELTLKTDKKDPKNKENVNKGGRNDIHKDFRNPIFTLSTQEGEMTLRQFSSVTELLGKLKVDLKLSFPSFVQEFVGDPVDGVTLLLELLRSVQLSQASQQRCPPQLLRRALLDEHSCLVCLKHCLRCSDATRKLASSPAGLFTLAVCIMSNVTKSRIIALELLTKACESPGNGHKAVSEALSTLRLRFGEPVRFRFLVGMLNSAGAVELLATAMKFINIFVDTAPNIQQKVYIQAELEQAGFDSKILRRTLPCHSESVKVELNRWEQTYFDVESLQNKVMEVDNLKEKLQIMERRIQVLQEEKGILQSVEQCLKERCSELEEEVSVKTSTTMISTTSKPFRNYNLQQNKKNVEKGESTPAEDEGISSSEQELSQDEDYIRGRNSYNQSTDFGEPVENSSKSRNIISEKKRPSRPNKISEIKDEKNCNIPGNMRETNVDDGNEILQVENDSNEEETTIDEVIEELENIVNDAETEVYKIDEKNKPECSKLKQQRAHLKKFLENSAEEKSHAFTKSPLEKENFEESEIVPSMLYPQPPRKTKSLVHIYFPGTDSENNDFIRSEFFDEDTDSESSDSLLTASREKRPFHKSCNKSLKISDSFNSFSSVNTRTLFIKQEEYENNEKNIEMAYEERNIDEEESKRKNLKTNMQSNSEKTDLKKFSPQTSYKGKPFPKIKDKIFFNDDQVTEKVGERLNKTNTGNIYEKSNLKEAKIKDKIISDSSFSKKIQKFTPAPVKRSQTFHISSSEGEKFFKRSDIKPKPKMGVSGLDFQRSTEHKIKNDNAGYLAKDYEKNTHDRFYKKVPQIPDNGVNIRSSHSLLRRGSFDGFSFEHIANDEIVSDNETNKNEILAKRLYDVYSPVSLHKTESKIKSKSLEKMDKGLDSLVDIVISPDDKKKQKSKNEWNVEVAKNIGPRTRRSLAESSLFTPQCMKRQNKLEESPKPPKPAQRISLTRTNSSSSPLQLPIEIKLAPVQTKQEQQIIYNFGLKQAKSEDSLLANSSKRHPPDGSSSPMDFKKSAFENQVSYNDKLPIYSTPYKQIKLQKFFGNPKFENSTGTENTSNQKYFESNYAAVGNNKVLSPMPRTNPSGSSKAQKQINLLKTSSQNKEQNTFKTAILKENQIQSKPNFLLGTYQTQSSKTNSSKSLESSSVLNSVNSFNSSFLMKRSNVNNNAYSVGMKKSQGYSNPHQNGRNQENGRQISTGNTSGSEKVTDSPSGLY